jgi:hypothetical protein
MIMGEMQRLPPRRPENGWRKRVPIKGCAMRMVGRYAR